MVDFTLTDEQKALREMGEEEQVRRLRDLLHRQMTRDAVGMVESITGRRVVSFLSQVDVDRDLLVDSFLLES